MVRRIWDSGASGDWETFRNLASRSDHIVSIGLASHHWWRGFEEAVGVWELHAEEIDVAFIDVEHLEGFESGSVGWAAGEGAVVSTSGERFPQRFTCVLELEAGTWRWVQWHSSRAIQSTDAWGFELTATLEGLVRSLDDKTDRELDRVSSSGTVTILFTDVEDSTSLSADMGDADWSEALKAHFATITQVVERCGGRVVKTIGDGAMAAFPGAEAAVTAAIQIQQRIEPSGLRVRVGVHTGDVQKVAGDYVGLTVNKAARVTSAAAGGEILLSSATGELVATSGYELGEAQTLEFKGLPGAHRVMRVSWQTAT